MVTTSLRQTALGMLIALSACAAAQAEALPREGRFNLQCSISIRTVSGPPVPAKITPNYAVDLDAKTWCNVEDHCAQHYALHKISETAVEFTITDSVADHEKFLVNLESGKLAGSADDAPNGLINGFRTYLAEGDCVPRPYSEGRQP
jgi:hypothetical protein